MQRKKFQFTLPRRKRRITRGRRGSSADFNSRFREGSDFLANQIKKEREISIHASAKEATTILFLRYETRLNFNSRFREGSDLYRRHTNAGFIDFNSRFREGSDKGAPGKDVPIIISIHASAKEATKKSWSGMAVFEFQFTLPRRKRHGDGRGSSGTGDFNSRFREGSDYLARRQNLQNRNFNSRFREGSDRTYGRRRTESRISIHASAKEATSSSTKIYLVN